MPCVVPLPSFSMAWRNLRDKSALVFTTQKRSKAVSSTIPGRARLGLQQKATSQTSQRWVTTNPQRQLVLPTSKVPRSHGFVTHYSCTSHLCCSVSAGVGVLCLFARVVGCERLSRVQRKTAACCNPQIPNLITSSSASKPPGLRPKRIPSNTHVLALKPLEVVPRPRMFELCAAGSVFSEIASTLRPLAKSAAALCPHGFSTVHHCPHSLDTCSTPSCGTQDASVLCPLFLRMPVFGVHRSVMVTKLPQQATLRAK